MGNESALLCRLPALRNKTLSPTPKCFFYIGGRQPSPDGERYKPNLVFKPKLTQSLFQMSVISSASVVSTVHVLVRTDLRHFHRCGQWWFAQDGCNITKGALVAVLHGEMNFSNSDGLQVNS